MKEYFKIAWRNLWRNKKRTLITVASIFFALLLALLMRSMHLGTWHKMISDSVRTSTGYLQVQKLEYWDDKSINNTFEASEEFYSQILNVSNVTEVVPRLESFSLVSFETQSKGVAVIGIDPNAEDQLLGLSKKIVAGEYLNLDDSGLLVSQGLAEYLKASVGDSIVLIGQGFQGATAAGLFKIKGILKMPGTDLNNQLIYLPLPLAQEYFSAYGRLTCYSIMLENTDLLEETKAEIMKLTSDDLVVMTWREMLTELVQSFEGDNVSALFMLGLLYLVVGFGILGTMIMMTIERRREFGIMIAVGLRKVRLNLIMFIETMLISILGIAASLAVTIPILYYMKDHPIRMGGEAAKALEEYNMDPVLPFLFDFDVIANQCYVVLIIAFIASLYPLAYISRLKIIKAMKGK